MSNSTQSKRSATHILAAGGVLETREKGDVRVAVVHRSRYQDRDGTPGDWVLPKGKVKSGESLEQTALREVREETGCHARIAGPSFGCEYMADGIPKVTLFFLMACEEVGTVRDTSEVDKVAWLTPKEAVMRLTYDTERAVLEQAYPALPETQGYDVASETSGPSDSSAPQTKTSCADDMVRKVRRERLSASLTELEQLIEFSAATADTKRPQIQYARKALSAARRAFDQGGSDEEVWPLHQQASRFVLESLGKEEVLSRRRALRREAEEKLKNWRKEAVLDILGRDTESERKVTASDLSFAQLLLDQHFQNVYFKLCAVGAHLRVLPWLLGTLVVLTFMLSLVLSLWLAPVQACSGDPAFFLRDCGQTLLILLLGAIGATLSNTLSTIGIGSRIPMFLNATAARMIRPLLGAISAVVVATVLQSGLLGVQVDNQLALYGWAVAAGFSDRILNTVMQKVERTAQQ